MTKLSNQEAKAVMDLAKRIEAAQNEYLKRAERVQKIIDNTQDKMIAPGLYEVTEEDYGGMYDIPVFEFRLEEEMNLKEIALSLIETRDYMSPWNDLRIRTWRPGPDRILTIGKMQKCRLDYCR